MDKIKEKTLESQASGSTPREASGVNVQPSNQIEQTKIVGFLTSNLRSRTSSNTPYMAFFRPYRECAKHSWEECERTKCQECEIPVVFRTGKKPKLNKGQMVILEGEYSDSKKSNRSSFTCFSYQVLKGDSK